MLDANLVLQDVEELLSGHYTEWRAQMQNRVRIYDTPPQQLAAKPPLPLQKPPNALNELVANVFVLLMLSVLNNGLAKQPLR